MVLLAHARRRRPATTAQGCPQVNRGITISRPYARTALAFRQAEFCGPDFLFGMETQMVTNIALEFVAFAVPRFFKCYGVCKRPTRIEHRTYGSREHLVVDLSFELLDDVIVQKILTDHKDNARRRCDKKIHKSRLFKITDIAN